MEREGIVDSITRRTINRYLSEAPAEETIEKIRESHAEADLQIAERQEQLYQRAREAEMNADKEVPIKRVFPETDDVPADSQSPMRWSEWEQIEPGDPDWPEWATPDRDVLIRFTDERTQVYPGERYPIKGIDGEPKYTTEFVGLEEVKNEKARAFRREEAREHLEAKGNALGVYEEQLDVNVGGSLELDHAVPEEIVSAVVGASHNRLDNDADGPDASDATDGANDDS